MQARYLVLTLVLYCFSMSQTHAELIITFDTSLDGNSTVMRADGTVDIRNLMQNSSNGIPQISAYKLGWDQRFFSNQGSSKGWTISTAVELFDVPGDFNFANSSLTDENQSGDSFGLQSVNDGDRLDRTALIVPSDFSVGQISGRAVLEGVRLSELNLIEQTISWGPSNDQRLQLVVVPEPAAASALVFLSGLLIRRSSN